MQSKIVKWGNSQGIRIPKILLEYLNIADNDTVDILKAPTRVRKWIGTVMLVNRYSKKQGDIMKVNLSP